MQRGEKVSAMGEKSAKFGEKGAKVKRGVKGVKGWEGC